MTQTDDQFYIDNQVAPPERIPHGGTVEELNEKYKIQAHHNWRQQGTLLLCECEIGSHGTNISPDYILTGTDEETGLPILTKVVIS